MGGVSLPPTTQVMTGLMSLGAVILPSAAILAGLDGLEDVGLLDEEEDLTLLGLESDTFKGTPVPITPAVNHYTGAPARQVSSRNRGLRRKRSFGDSGGGSSLAPHIPFAPYAAPLVHATAPGSTDMPAASNPASDGAAMAGIADLDFFSGDDPMDEVTGADGAVLPEQCTPAFGGPTREVSYLLEHWDEFWFELMHALEAEYSDLAKMLFSPPEAAEEEELLSPHRWFLQAAERISASATGTVPCVTLIAQVLTDPELKVQLSPDIYEVGRPQGVGGEP